MGKKIGQNDSEADKPENPLNNNTNEKYDSRGRKRQADCPKNGKNAIFGQSGVIDIAPNGQNIYKKAKIRKSPHNKKKRTEGDRIDKDAPPGQNNDEMSQGALKKRSASANKRENKDTTTRHAMIRGLTRKEKQIMKGVRKNNSAGEAHRRNEARTIDTSNGQRTIYTARTWGDGIKNALTMRYIHYCIWSETSTTELYIRKAEMHMVRCNYTHLPMAH